MFEYLNKSALNFQEQSIQVKLWTEINHTHLYRAQKPQNKPFRLSNLTHNKPVVYVVKNKICAKVQSREQTTFLAIKDRA